MRCRIKHPIGRWPIRRSTKPTRRLRTGSSKRSRQPFAVRTDLKPQEECSDSWGSLSYHSASRYGSSALPCFSIRRRVSLLFRTRELVEQGPPTCYSNISLQYCNEVLYWKCPDEMDPN